MAQLQIRLIRQGLVSTTDGTTWTTVGNATIDIPDGSVVRVSVWVLGRNTSTGAVVSAEGKQRGKRVSGTLSLVGVITDLISIVLGSDTALNTSDYRINVNSSTLELQVKGVAATTVEWRGEITADFN